MLASAYICKQCSFPIHSIRIRETNLLKPPSNTFLRNLSNVFNSLPHHISSQTIWRHSDKLSTHIISIPKLWMEKVEPQFKSFAIPCAIFWRLWITLGSTSYRLNSQCQPVTPDLALAPNSSYLGAYVPRWSLCSSKCYVMWSKLSLTCYGTLGMQYLRIYQHLSKILTDQWSCLMKACLEMIGVFCSGLANC